MKKKRKKNRERRTEREIERTEIIRLKNWKNYDEEETNLRGEYYIIFFF